MGFINPGSTLIPEGNLEIQHAQLTLRIYQWRALMLRREFDTNSIGGLMCFCSEIFTKGKMESEMNHFGNVEEVGIRIPKHNQKVEKKGIRIRNGPFWHPIYTIDLIIFKQDIIRCVFWCSVEVGPINTKQTSTRCSRQCIQLGVETATTISISDENPMFSSHVLQVLLSGRLVSTEF